MEMTNAESKYCLYDEEHRKVLDNFEFDLEIFESLLKVFEGFRPHKSENEFASSCKNFHDRFITRTICNFY